MLMKFEVIGVRVIVNHIYVSQLCCMPQLCLKLQLCSISIRLSPVEHVCVKQYIRQTRCRALHSTIGIQENAGKHIGDS